MTKAEYDVVIVGSGVGGLATALALAMLGRRPVVLEKSALIGGASCVSFGATWVGNNHLAAEAGIADDAADVAAYFEHMSGGEGDASRARALAEHGARMLRHFEPAGIGFKLMRGVNDSLYGKAPGAVKEGRTLEPLPIDGSRLGAWRDRLSTKPGHAWRVPDSVMALATGTDAVAALTEDAIANDQIAQGAALVAQFLCALQAHDVSVLTGRHVERLVQNGDRVVGVGLHGGEILTARHGVVLATGTYTSNPVLAAEIDRLPGLRSWYPPTHQGEGLLMATAIGASIAIIRNYLNVALGYPDPTDPNGTRAGLPSVRDLPRAHSMIVNRAGQRFGNEGSFQELAGRFRELDIVARRLKNLPCWMIFDGQFIAKTGIAGSAPGTVPDWVISAPTLAELAARTGIDPSGLEATAARFNGFAVTGVDLDFGRKPGWALSPGLGAGPNPSIGAIAEAPFHAIGMLPTTAFGSGGLKTDAAGRALDWRRRPIAGLHAVGDVAVHDELGIGYQSGVTFSSTLTFALLAAEDIHRAAA